MSVLEIELKHETQQRLNQAAAKRGLPASELVRVAVENLLAAEEVNEQPKHSIMELHGIGKGAWAGIDVQQYINEMRDEWDKPE